MLIFGPFGKSPKAEAAGPAALREVRAYWEALRDEGRLPSREQIDPRGLSSALEQVFLIERIAPGHARFRLAGHHLHDLMGMDVRGMPLAVLFEPVARQGLQPLVEEVFAGPHAVHLVLEGERGIGRPAITGHMLLLPLRPTAGESPLALGVLASDGAIGRAPRRFCLGTSRVEPVTSGPIIVEQFRKAEVNVTGLREGPTRAAPPELALPDPRTTPRLNALLSGPAAAERPKPHKKPKLRLVVSND